MELGPELDALIGRFLDDYLSRNRAATVLHDALEHAGVGFWPVLDHLTLRTSAIDRRAEDFVRLGYTFSETLYFDDWYAKVYRAPGYPALFIDQAYDDERGKTSIIPGWVAAFGDDTFHHVAVRVEDIEHCIERLKAKEVKFAGDVVGARGESLRQIFTAPEAIDGEPFSVLELTERRFGYLGFSPPKADALMQSSAKRI